MRDYAGAIPVLLEADLFTSGWNGALQPYPLMTPKQKAMQSLRSSILKKFQDVKGPSADAAALSLFLSINEKCRSFKMDTSRCTEAEAIALGEAKDFLYRLFFPDNQENGPLFNLTLSEVTSNFGVGNGANIGSYSTDFLSKVGTSTMAATNPALHKLYVQAISCDPLWSDVEYIRSQNRKTEIVRGSRLSFVPKTTAISRTICTEPICNMLFQKGIAAVLTRLIRRSCGIDLRTQPDKNRELARLGSIDGRFGTIDLSSASDSMSLSLVREMFPRHVYDMLVMSRSPMTVLPDGTEVELHMISSMGNAYTFPLQTLLFAALVYGAYRVRGIHLSRPGEHSLGNFAVYGDDIIVLEEAYDLTVRLLSLCGFSVNIDKSFNEGLFRESCGHDYYHGHNVRGVYIQTLRDVSDRYSAINRLNRWSALWGVPLPRVVSFLMKGTRFLPVPFDEQDDSGIKVPCRALSKKVFSRRGFGIRYRALVSEPRSYDISDCEARPPKVRGWFKNPSAVLLAAIAGTLRASKLTVRSTDRKRTSLRYRYSSRWDYIPAEHAVMRVIDERWKSLVEVNLNLF